MSQFYNILEYQEGDTYPSKFNGDLQTFWLTIEGVEGTIKVDKKVGNYPKLGQNYGYLETKLNKKGGTYFKFHGEKIPEGTAVPAGGTPPRPVQHSTPQNTSTGMPAWFVPVAKQIDYIYQEMKKVDSEEPLPAVEVEEEEENPVQTKLNALSPEVKATMDDIFGPSEDEAVEDEKEE